MSVTKKDSEKIDENRQHMYQSYHAYMTQQQQQEQMSYSAPEGMREHHPYQNPNYYNWPQYYYPYYYGNQPMTHPFYINQNNPNENTTQLNTQNNEEVNVNVSERRSNAGGNRNSLINRKHKIGALHFKDNHGVQPLFINALHIMSVAVLIIVFPLTLLSSGYIGPGSFIFACGPVAAIFSFWAVYITPCECFPNIEWAIKRIKIFATIAAVLDIVGAIGSPITLHGASCPDDDDTLLTCEDEIVTAQGISIASSCILIVHLFLCLLVRSNAHRLAESKFEVLEGAYNIMMDPMEYHHPVPDDQLNEELMNRN